MKNLNKRSLFICLLLCATIFSGIMIFVIPNTPTRTAFAAAEDSPSTSHVGNLSYERDRLYSEGLTDIEVANELMRLCGYSDSMIAIADTEVKLSFLETSDSWIKEEDVINEPAENSDENNLEYDDNKLYLFANLRRLYDFDEGKVIYVATLFFEWKKPAYFQMTDIVAVAMSNASIIENSQFNQSYFKIIFPSIGNDVVFEFNPQIKTTMGVASIEIDLGILGNDTSYDTACGYLQIQFNPATQAERGGS